MEIQNKKELRRTSMLGLAGMVASAVLGATLTYSTMTTRHEIEMNELKHNAVFERVNLYLNESKQRADKDEQVDRNELIRQYGIPLTDKGEIDYHALQNAMFPPRE